MDAINRLTALIYIYIYIYIYSILYLQYIYNKVPLHCFSVSRLITCVTAGASTLCSVTVLPCVSTVCVFVCFSGFFMYIETSRPRKDGDTARLLSPTFSVTPKNPVSITSPPVYCFSFYYHMYGKHIGKSHRRAKTSTFIICVPGPQN